MKKKIFDQRINYLFLLISFIFLGVTIGFGNISFQSVEWLHDGNESAIEQTAWYFFRNDVWRLMAKRIPSQTGSNPIINSGGATKGMMT